MRLPLAIEVTSWGGASCTRATTVQYSKVHYHHSKHNTVKCMTVLIRIVQPSNPQEHRTEYSVLLQPVLYGSALNLERR